MAPSASKIVVGAAAAAAAYQAAAFVSAPAGQRQLRGHESAQAQFQAPSGVPEQSRGSSSSSAVFAAGAVAAATTAAFASSAKSRKSARSKQTLIPCHNSATDTEAINSVRFLAVDAINKSKSGHPGAPMGQAPIGYVLYAEEMVHNPKNPRFVNRDRFVLSSGHGCMLQYSLMHLTGYESVTMDDIKQFRQWNSRTPGHPENFETEGIEVTTGPLGMGISNAVGLAAAEAHLSAKYNKPGYSVVDHYTYTIMGDGCMQEGISHESCAYAGHLKLGKLIAFYDDNKITIDGTTDIAFSEDVGGVFAARGWHIVHIPCGDLTDASVFEKAVMEAKSQSEKPTLVIMRTTIGCGAGSGIEGKPKAHGGKFSNLEEIRRKYFSVEGLKTHGDPVDQQVAELVERELSDLDAFATQGYAVGGEDGSCLKSREVLPKFHVPKQVLRRFRSYGEQGDKLAAEWEQMVERYVETYKDKEPALVKDLQNRLQGKYLTEEWPQAMEDYRLKERQNIDAGIPELRNLIKDGEDSKEPAAKRRKVGGDPKFKYKAGRVYAAEVLRTMVQHNPSVMGGSADVASSCGGHFLDLQGHFLPKCYAEKGLPGASYEGRYIHFGVREHATLAILNGLSSYACIVPYSALFTVFYQYGLPAIRMATLSKFPVLYIGTHDSIDLGEDGPTHQPVEVLPQLRAMPNLLVLRPACVDEMVGAFEVFAEQYDAPRLLNQYVDPKPLKRRPVFIMTSRGELGLPYKSNAEMMGREGVHKGAYVVHECFESPAATNGTASMVRQMSLGTNTPLPDIVLIGSGQDVALCMKTKEILLEWSTKFNEQVSKAFADFPVGVPGAASFVRPAPLKIRIVSMPCWELFDEQDEEYQDSVLLSHYNDILRVYVEKAATKNTGHDKYAHFSVLMSSYGLSGKASEVERKLEFTPDFIASKVWAEWVDRGRRLPKGGDLADQGLSTWVSRLRHRMH
eukprot:TRINITY_DN678_c0_g1_i5.p1 TRINITY_DN678_c0_g1~~TRINITY_DN678_c0_g1_i5.p1  ORF type:complete len:982 (-),score=266.98 TRINITY_DN678_c0_g1_i5:102-2993(-)